MNASDIIEDIDEEMPLELMEHAKAALMETLPAKSKEKYNRVYKNFKEWQLRHGVASISSELIMAYFHVLHEKNYKPTSLWAFHSMLKATLRAIENIDIGKFCQVTSFLKTKSSGYKCVKAMVFKEAEIQKFISEAEDSAWLDVKVVCIFGICGACRTDELTRITMDDVQRHGDLFLVKLEQTKTKVSGSFTINGGFAAIVQKYIDLRPTQVETNKRFFMNYQRGKCTMQFIGKNKLSLMPRRMAEYLGLAKVERYTGHAFRRTSATILANNGADLEDIMRHGRWRNGACAKGYIDDSIQYKARTGQVIQCSVLGSVATTFGAALTVAPSSIFAPTSAPVIASESAASSSVSSVNSEFLFDSSISDVDLIDIVDGASQTYERERNSVRETVAPSSVPAALSSVSSVKNEFLFDSSIPDVDLIDIVDGASQTYERERNSVRETVKFVRNESRKTEKDADESALANLTQSNNNSIASQLLKNSSLNAILARSFKSVNFERMENCTFNLYLSEK